MYIELSDGFKLCQFLVVGMSLDSAFAGEFRDSGLLGLVWGPLFLASQRR